MARIPLSHSLGLEHKSLALAVHDIEHGLPIIKSVREGPVKRIIDIFDIKGGDLTSVLFYRALDRIRPRTHIVYIGPGDRQTVNSPS